LREHLLRAARALALSFASVFLPLVGLATVTSLRAHAWTWVQLGVALGAVLVAAMLALALPKRRRVRRAAGLIALVALARIAWAAFPRHGVEHPGALVKTRFVGSPPDTRLFWQGLPERETVRLGALVDLSPREREQSLASIEAAYAAIETGDLFERVESPLLDSWFFDREHFWLAAPATKGPLPLVVFVHGNGGTFQFYPHLLARGAVERGLAIAFPSNGFGFWGGSDAPGRVARVVDAVARELPIDRTRVALVGLSAGGEGVFGAALHDPGSYRAVAAVSAVFPPLDRAGVMKGTKVLILHGAQDPRASIEGARKARDDLARTGVAVELDEDPGADHLALVAHERWAPRLLDWLVGATRE
jgi:dienelactone hydrolase